MSGVGALNYSSDMDQFNVTNPLTENVNRAMMPPPPPMKPKNTKRIVTLNDSGNSTPPMPDYRANTESKSFGRFPRGALVWSSNGKPEFLNNSNLSSLQGSKLDFSPLSVLSPFNPSTPLSGVQSGKANTPNPDSSAPLNNSTNSDHKVKRVILNDCKLDTKRNFFFFISYIDNVDVKHNLYS